MAKFTIKDVRKIPSGDTSRIGKMDTVITYELDPLHVYMVTIGKDAITEADVVQAVKDDLENMARFIGRELDTGQT